MVIRLFGLGVTASQSKVFSSIVTRAILTGVSSLANLLVVIHILGLPAPDFLLSGCHPLGRSDGSGLQTTDDGLDDLSSSVHSLQCHQRGLFPTRLTALLLQMVFHLFTSFLSCLSLEIDSVAPIATISLIDFARLHCEYHLV